MIRAKKIFLGVFFSAVLAISMLPSVWYAQSAQAQPLFTAGFVNTNGQIGIKVAGSLVSVGTNIADSDILTLSKDNAQTNDFAFSGYFSHNVVTDAKKNQAYQCVANITIRFNGSNPSNGLITNTDLTAGSLAGVHPEVGCPADVISTLKSSIGTLSSQGISIPIANPEIFKATIGSTTQSVTVLVIPQIDTQKGQTIDPSKAPASDVITLKDANGNAIGQPLTTAAPSTGDQDTPTLTYTATFNNVGPGNYQVCSQVLNNQCKTFTEPGISTISIQGTAANALSVTKDDNQNGTAQTPSCENSGSFIGWILCGIYNDTAKLVDFLLHNLVEPLLKTDPISTDPSTSTYQIWSNFRIYGNIFLVIALLVVVFGEAIGGGLIEAYTVRKMLPRILVAVILINLSVYIVALMVDITNILGAGIGQLLTAPLGNAAQFKFVLGAGQQRGLITMGSVVGVGAYLGGLLVVKAAAGGTSLFSLAGSALPAILLFVVMPAVLSLLAVIFTILIRKAAILFLVLVSPVAFALYCLPNTEKYFRKWLDLLFTTLLVYPIIMIFFAVSDILSVTIMNANNAGTGGPLLAKVPQIVNGDFLAPLVAFIALFLPLILIPYSFRLAGGAVGKIHETLTNYHKKGQEAIKGNINDPNSLRNKARIGLKNAYNARSSDILNDLRESTKPGGRNASGLRRRAAVARMRAINVGDLDKKRSVMNETFKNEIGGKVAKGSDFLERAFWAVQWTEPRRSYTDANGQTQWLETGNWYSPYKDSNGVYGVHSPGDVSAAHARYDGNQSKVQALLEYETGKVPSDGDFFGFNSQGEAISDPTLINKPASEGGIDYSNAPIGSFMSNLPNTMKNAGLSPFGAGGASIGSFFATQNAHRELKHYRLQGDGTWKIDEHAYVQDFAENVGLYMDSNAKAGQTKALTQIYKNLVAKKARVDAKTPQKVKYKGQGGEDIEVDESWTPVDERSMKDLTSIATTLDTSYGGGFGGAQHVGDDGSVIPSAGGRGTGAAGRVNAAIQEFVNTVPHDTTPRRGGTPGGGDAGGGGGLILPGSPDFRVR